jgi:citrate lyase beta subunit
MSLKKHLSPSPSASAPLLPALLPTATPEVDFGGSERAVRINPVSSGLASLDLQAVLGGKQLPDALVVPKLESSSEIQWLREEVRHLLRNRGVRGDKGKAPLALITMCESAMGLLNLRWVKQQQHLYHNIS